MMTPSRGPAQDLVGSLAGNLKHPWVFGAVLLLFVTDLLIPDPIPFVDEIMLALLTLLVGTWRTRRKAAPEVVDVSPQLPDSQTPSSR